MRRYLCSDLYELALKRHKMAFLSGPRQVGKTTLAKSLAGEFDSFLYKNWDEVTFRRIWTKSPLALVNEFPLAKSGETRLLTLDEIHKAKGWKSRLKGLFDEVGDELSIMVTGSARLNIYKRGGDSLLGRYLNFRLHPLSLGELSQRPSLPPEDWRNVLLNPRRKLVGSPANLMDLLRYGGFPEPFFSKSDKLLNIWRTGRHEKIIREDLRDLSRINELSQVEMLASILPTKVGSPLSTQSLREDLEVSFDTVKRWLNGLEELYFFFRIYPWTKSIPRTLKKEPKLYLFDWTELDDEGPRFENLIASHLLKACHYWVDTGAGAFDLHYLRNKEKQEVDFLITLRGKPWLMIEAKRTDANLDSKTAATFQKHMHCPYVQVVLEDGIHRTKNDQIVMSAATFLAGLP